MLKLTLTGDTLEISGSRNEPDFQKINAELINSGLDKIVGENTLSYTGEIKASDLEWLVETIEEQNIEYIDTNGNLKAKRKQRKQGKQHFEQLLKKGRKIKSKKFNIRSKRFKKDFRFRDFQTTHIQHTIDIDHSANFSVPGAGKTLMTYAAFDHLKSQGKVDQLWVIGPKPSFVPWEEEYEKLFRDYDKNKIIRYVGSKTKRISLFPDIKNAEVVLVNFELAIIDSGILAKAWELHKKNIFLVIDESHHIKTYKTETDSGADTSAVALIKLGTSENVVKRCILTGTPLPWKWYDLYSQFTFLYPNEEVFGTRGDFENVLLEEDAEKIIGKRISGIWSRVTLKELEKVLPKTSVIPVPVKMDELQEKIYELIEEQELDEMDEGFDKDEVTKLKAAKIIRLLQAVTNPRLILQNDRTFNLSAKKATKNNAEIMKQLNRMSKQEVSPKLRRAADICNHLTSARGYYKSDDKKRKNVIIYTLFRGNVRILGKLLAFLDPIEVTGDYDLPEREKRIQEFKQWDPEKEKHGRVLIATLGSIAEAVSLHMYKKRTVCQHVIYLERSYNAGQYMQSMYRVYRIGSDKRKPIIYYQLESISQNGLPTIDANIDRTLKGRVKTMNKLLDDRMYLHLINLGEDYETKEHKKKEVEYSFAENENYDEILKNVKKLRDKRHKSRK